MSTRFLRSFIACSLALGGNAGAQVFEVGEDGVMREAAGIGPRPALDDDGVPRPASPAFTVQPSRWVVQLGAYPDIARLEAEWLQISTQHADLLAGYDVARVPARVSGRSFIRLSITGLENLKVAQSLCRELRGRGTACFVREAAPSHRGAGNTPPPTSSPTTPHGG